MSKLNIPKGVKDTWETPPALFDALDKEFGPFDLDAACQPDDYTAMVILARGGDVFVAPGSSVGGYREDVTRRTWFDGLALPWRGRVWLNPPYGPALAEWVPKAAREVQMGNAELVCALLPARPGGRWWQDNILRELSGLVQPRRTGLRTDAHPNLDVLRLLPGRVTFVGAPGPANFDSAIVVWRR